MSEKKILITGATGFLGDYVYRCFSEQQYEISTLGRKKIGKNHIYADFNDIFFELPSTHFSMVVHLAGKAHVHPRTKKEEAEFDQINNSATQRLLNQLEFKKSLPDVFIFASTVAVYGIEKGINVDETHPLLPKTPYGISKLNAENAIINWCKRLNVKYFILRLPLLIGSNPPGNLGSIKNAIQKGFYFSIKNNCAQKSMVLAEDVAILLRTITLDSSGIYNLTDGSHPTFNQIETAIAKSLDKKINISLSLGLVKILGCCGDLALKFGLPSPLNASVIDKMTNSLTFNDSKARKELNWNPQPVLPFLEKHI